MGSKLFESFYGNNNTLEVCIILFDKCNLHCKFCFEDHRQIISCNEIKNKADKIVPQLEEILIKRPQINAFTFRLWGGELFMDGITDEYFEAYHQLIALLRKWCQTNDYKCEFCFSSNLVFTKIARVCAFIESNKQDTYIATSYDPVARFSTPLLEERWWKNVEILKPRVISITLTKPAIEKYISTDILDRLSKYELYPEYYIYNKDWEIYAPTEEELFMFLKYCYEHKISNIPEVTAIIDSYSTPQGNGRYCFCYNSCSIIKDKLVFSCLLRSGTMHMLPEYGMTLEECYDNDNCTEKQFNIVLSRLKCLQCKHFGYCRLPCMASRMHKEVSNTKCHLKLFYEWLDNVNRT